MATEAEDWSAWDVSAGDGLADLSWEATPRSRVAEATPEYPARRRKRGS
jgi:hypothetical protein